MFAAVLLVMQAVDWFGPEPTEVDITLPARALPSYGVAIALGLWGGATRERIAAPAAVPTSI